MNFKFSRDIAAATKDGAIVVPDMTYKSFDEPLVVLISVILPTGLPSLYVLSQESNLYPKMTPFIRRFEDIVEVEESIEYILDMLVDEGEILEDAPFYVCMESKAAAILAAQSVRSIKKMQTVHTIRSTLQ